MKSQIWSWFIFVCFIFFNVAPISSGWFTINSGTTTIRFHKIFMIDENIGFIAGNENTILKTTNGGLNWTRLTSTGNATLRDLYFKDYNTGIVCGYLPELDPSAFTRITTNGGINWSTNNYLSNACQVYSMDFPIVDTGYIVGACCCVFKTTNSGLNWSLLPFQPSFLTSLHFLDSRVGFVTQNTGTSKSIYKTSNGGVNWIVKYSNLNASLIDIKFINQNTGIVVGVNGFVIKTINGGDNWNLVTTNTNENFNCLEMEGNGNFYAAGSTGIIFKSTNFGNNWYSQNSGTSWFLTSIQFVNVNTGFVVGYGGTILKTTDGGGPVGINNIGENIPSFFKLHQNYPNPFNPSTKIKFDFPKSGVFNFKVFDVSGTEVYKITENRSAGVYEIEFDASNLPSGLYIYELRTEDFAESKKMILLK